MEPLPPWPTALNPGWLKPFREAPDLLPAEALETLRQDILRSPYLADTTLNERFAGTRGFTVVFTREGLDEVERHFPSFIPYLVKVLHPRCNAFYLNPLVIRKGARVQPHRDRSLRSWVKPREPGYPLKVSVLYVQKPDELRGGQLILHRRGPVGRFDPRPNLLVEFRGFLRHEVTEVVCDGDEIPARISLVCEQYRLPAAVLELVPPFAVKSKRTFEDFMKDAMQEPPPVAGRDGPEPEVSP